MSKMMINWLEDIKCRAKFYLSWNFLYSFPYKSYKDLVEDADRYFTNAREVVFIHTANSEICTYTDEVYKDISSITGYYNLAVRSRDNHFTEIPFRLFTFTVKKSDLMVSVIAVPKCPKYRNETRLRPMLIYKRYMEY